MLRQALFLARSDIRHMFRARETWVWAFVMPVVFFYFIGTVTGGYGSPRPPAADPIAAEVAPDAGPLADRLLARVAARNYRIVRARDEKELAQYSRRLRIPSGFTEAVLARRPVILTLERTGGGESADYDQARLSRAIAGLLAEGPPLLTVAVHPAGKRRHVPTGFEQSVPGTMVMFVLLVLFTTGSVTLVIERRQGILRRLASSPMPRGAVALGKWGARLALGLIQIAFAVLAGTALFHVRWGAGLPMVLLVLLSYAALAAALSLLLGNLARTEGQAIGIGVLASNVMAALGGCWWPIEITPPWAQSLSLALPTGWTMDALHKLVSFGAGPMAVLPHVLMLAGGAFLAGWLAARTFRFSD
jgi:hypothetical protein